MARGLPNWRMSAPAMKLRPAPIITIAFTPASTSPFSSASTMPSRTPGPNALTGGLSMVMTPTPSSTSNRTSSFSPSAMAFPPAYPASRASGGGIAICSPNTVDFRARPQLRSGREALAYGRDRFGAIAAGEQAVVADAVEALGQDVGEEAADELIDVERHRRPQLLFKA